VPLVGIRAGADSDVRPYRDPIPPLRKMTRYDCLMLLTRWSTVTGADALVTRLDSKNRAVFRPRYHRRTVGDTASLEEFPC
jgi:hypothetical protein